MVGRFEIKTSRMDWILAPFDQATGHNRNGAQDKGEKEREGVRTLETVPWHIADEVLNPTRLILRLRFVLVFCCCIVFLLFVLLFL